MGGRLLGISIRTKLPLKLHLAYPAFKLLAGESLTKMDLKSLNLSFVEKIEKILASDDEQWEELASEFTKETRKEYAELTLARKLKSWDKQASWIRAGIKDIVPVSLLSVLTGRDIQEYVSAPYSSTDSIIWDDLPKSCTPEGFPAPETHGEDDHDDKDNDILLMHPVLQWFWSSVRSL